MTGPTGRDVEGTWFRGAPGAGGVNGRVWYKRLEANICSECHEFVARREDTLGIVYTVMSNRF